MRKVSSLVLVLALTLVPILAQGSGCLSQHTVVGTVQPVKAPPPTELPAKGAPYALYWLFHTWCHSCQSQAGVIKHFRDRYGREVQVYAVPLSGTPEEVKRFLTREGLSSLPVMREASDAFGTISGHPVLVFRKTGPSYYRINGYTPLPDLERLFTTFKRA